MRRRGQGSASISAVVVFLSALLAIGLMATILPPVANVLSGFREGLRERGERGSELIRIYIHTATETELEPPIITIINGYDRESVLTDYVVVARDGRILAAGKMGGSLGGIRIPAGARIDLTPADFGLSYGTFAAMADEVKAIYIRTAEGNSFGSSYGPPPKINPDYQLKISQRSQHIIVIPTTTTRYNFTITGNITLPTTGDAMVVKNVILVDRNGIVRGGATAGNKWSDGSFDPNKIPDSLAALTKTTEVVPIGGYYVVPPFPTDFWCGYTQIYGVFSVYSGCDTRPQYIEMVEFYPIEYYTPGSPVGVAAYYARYGGETQTVYNPDWGRVVTVTAQRPAVPQYGYLVPGVYIQSVIATYISSGTPTRTYTTTLVTPVTVWQEGNLIKYAPIFDPRLAYYSGDQRAESCRFEFDGRGGQYRCDFTLRPPTADWARLIAIKGVGFEVSVGQRNNVCYNEDGFSKVTYVMNVTYPGGSYTATNQRRWSMWRDLPVGDVSFAFEIRMEPCQQLGNGRIIGHFSGWVVYEGFWRAATATATLVRDVITTRTVTNPTITNCYYDPGVGGVCLIYTLTTTYTTSYLTTIPIDFQNQIKSAIVNGTETVSGDAVAHLAGTVQGGQVIKIKAPIVLLNYIYGIAGSPPTSPPSRGGGGGEIGAKMECTLDQSVQSVMPSPSDSDSSGSSTNQPLESISGGTVSDFSVQQSTVQVLRNVVCRPVTPSRSLPSPN
jgi:hypothetical protein